MTEAKSVLVVEDDPASASFLKHALTRSGYSVLVAGDVASAKDLVTKNRSENFGSIITDYRMPGQTGLDLLTWIKSYDATLATVVVTAEGERQLIAESLRNGAADFLDKPVNKEKLLAAVERAMRQTQRQRQLAQSENAIREVGRAQEWMLGQDAARGTVRTGVCFHPRHDAGGDFFTQFQPTPKQVFCLLTDVSGHDLHAAYISAYFQGIVRGMLERNASVDEIFRVFNQLLLDEWNGGKRLDRKAAATETSVAACAILIDSGAQTATVVSHGTPAPVFWQPDGSAEFVGEHGGSPLGWFSELSPRSRIQPTFGDGRFCFWTDGLEDLAQSQGVSDLSMAFALQNAREQNKKLPGIDAAQDDILLADIHLAPARPSKELFRPLILEYYPGNRIGEIDDMQALWQRSFNLALPRIGEASMHDILLASREAVLNAMRHGCRGSELEEASFQAAYNPASETVRVRVCDPGPGHGFNFEQACPVDTNNLPDGHRGLLLVKHCATKMSLGQNGATVTMDFDVS